MNRLARWSRLKRGEVVDLPTEDKGPDDPMAHASPSGAPCDTRDAPTDSADLSPGSLDASLPDPDTLPPGSDIKAFLAPGVSAGLRQRALRRLFAAKHYNVRDGLDDYDDDYRQCLKPLASEVAQRLRRWAESTQESVTDDDTQSASADDPTGKRSPRDTSPTQPPTPESAPRDASDNHLPVTDTTTRGEGESV
ncbi:DUF3306 domain-containing protein [Halomonas cerina]|uniref:DUF3306 domain-containing protein n=1 Tax=Halomonas cerina TaxID=447424 RepID=A0A839V8Q9_9GAMM|nr:DUF3306 domain-containing protein [Halomonas cerina]MBB3189094.1 hypothetical protein [Halomonas cerina]